MTSEHRKDPHTCTGTHSDASTSAKHARACVMTCARRHQKRCPGGPDTCGPQPEDPSPHSQSCREHKKSWKSMKPGGRCKPLRSLRLRCRTGHPRYVQASAAKVRGELAGHHMLRHSSHPVRCVATSTCADAASRIARRIRCGGGTCCSRANLSWSLKITDKVHVVCIMM